LEFFGVLGLLDTREDREKRGRENESGKKCLKEIVFHVLAQHALIQMTLNISFLFLARQANRREKDEGRQLGSQLNVWLR
jgi:hypothetical protein